METEQTIEKEEKQDKRVVNVDDAIEQLLEEIF